MAGDVLQFQPASRFPTSAVPLAAVARPAVTGVARPAVTGVAAGTVPHEERARNGCLNGGQACNGAAVQHFTAALPCPWPDVHEPVGAADHVHVVLHHEHCVAGRPQLLQHRQEGLGVGGMQAGGGLVQHIHHAEQTRAELGGNPEALHLPRGKGGGRPAQGQIAEPQLQQDRDPLQEVPRDGDSHLIAFPGGLPA